MIGRVFGLPQPNEHFVWVQAAAGPALICAPLAAVARHLYTTRQWPLGTDSLQPGYDRAWRDVALAMEVTEPDLVRLRQVHGATAVSATAARGIRPAADVVFSDARHLAVAVQAADCAPILFADLHSGFVAAAHAGWRGMAARAPAAAVQSLEQEFGTSPADVIAAIGPSIGSCCYEVGADVRDAFMAAGFTAEALSRWFLPAPAATRRNPSMKGLADSPRAGRWFFDGWACVREQLAAAGVPDDQIFAAALCTASHAEVFCSYRRDGQAVGRMAAAIRRLP
jgi:YfiH family protein